jgi:dynein heavy chain
MDHDITPILYLYEMLDHHLPEDFVNKEEMDMRIVLRNSWRKLIKMVEAKTQSISAVQNGFKTELVKNTKLFTADVIAFRQDYEQNGPGEYI